MLQLEDYGFCEKGEGRRLRELDGIMRLGGERPNNTSGGHLCEGYTHGINMVIENVRQLRARRGRQLPGRARTASVSTPTTTAKAAAGRSRTWSVTGQHGLGHARHRLGHGHGKGEGTDHGADR